MDIISTKYHLQNMDATDCTSGLHDMFLVLPFWLRHGGRRSSCATVDFVVDRTTASESSPPCPLARCSSRRRTAAATAAAMAGCADPPGGAPGKRPHLGPRAARKESKVGSLLIHFLFGWFDDSHPRNLFWKTLLCSYVLYQKIWFPKHYAKKELMRITD